MSISLEKVSSEKRLTIAVGMSGGVDSSIAAYLLKQQGHKVIGLTMMIWDDAFKVEGLGKAGCYGPGEKEDLESTKKIADRLGIEHYCVDLAKDYKERVLDYFRDEYLAGKTPNPCVKCNRFMKFGLLLERAKEQGIEFDRFATGHYVRVGFDENKRRMCLYRGQDPKKDQSYFLSHLRQSQLEQVVFPLGDFAKGQIKQLANEIGWTDLNEKPESQDFIESDSYDVLFKPGEAAPGPMKDSSGKIVGQHEGIIHYTVGQRRGLGVGGAAAPLYVVGVDKDSNTVKIGPRSELMKTELLATELNWIAYAECPKEGFRSQVKIRQQHKPAWAFVCPDQLGNNPAVRVVFDEPQMAITPGQTAAFYDKDMVLGAGVISHRLRDGA